MLAVAVVLLLPAVTRADYITVKSSYLNVRSGPGTTFQIVRTITEGESFQLAETKGLWCRIILDDGSEAWVYRSYVEVRKGDMPGMVKKEEIQEPDTTGRETSLLMKPVILAVGITVLLLVFWRRRQLRQRFSHWMQAWSGYRREDPFRYDHRRPERDEWKL